MIGRVCIVTGANIGIGKATAKQLAAKGATVILACRNPAKADAARDEIVQITGNPNVTTGLLDLSNLSSIREFVQTVQHKHPHINLLINNAGVMNTEPKFIHGIEHTFGPFYLTNLLLARLTQSVKETGVQSRIVNITSRLEKNAKIDLNDMSGNQHNYNMWQAYSVSKLCNLLFTYELNRRIMANDVHINNNDNSNDHPRPLVTVNAVTPGLVNTALGRGAPRWQQILSYPFRALVMKTSDSAAEDITQVATNAVFDHVSGAYFGNAQAIKSSDQSYNLELAKAVWNWSDSITINKPTIK